MEKRILTAAHAHGDIVGVNLGLSGHFWGAAIHAIHFTPGKVKYDLDIPIIQGEEEVQTSRIYNVDSALIMNEESYLKSIEPQVKS